MSEVVEEYTYALVCSIHERKYYYVISKSENVKYQILDLAKIVKGLSHEKNILVGF
jgi:hypothetical protein